MFASDSESVSALILGFPGCRTTRNKLLLFISQSVELGRSQNGLRHMMLSKTSFFLLPAFSSVDHSPGQSFIALCALENVCIYFYLMPLLLSRSNSLLLLHHLPAGKLLVTCPVLYSQDSVSHDIMHAFSNISLCCC